MADPGCLSLFGADLKRHSMFAEHVTSEYRVPTQGRGRTVDQWKLRPQRPDNHWFDCLVGCAVAASIQGVELPGATTPTGRQGKGRRISLREVWERKQAKRHRLGA